MCLRRNITASFLVAVIGMVSESLDADTEQDAIDAEEPAAERDTASEDSNESGALEIEYKPPSRGAPGNRVGAGTKDIGGQVVRLMAPGDHIPYSLSLQPVLYWSVVDPLQGDIEIEIRNADRNTVEYRTTLDTTPLNRLAALSTADAGVRLEPETVYCWTASYWPRSSKSLISDTSRACFSTRPSAAFDPESRQCSLSNIRTLASRGYWYDALHCAVTHDSEAVRQETLNALLDHLGVDAE